MRARESRRTRGTLSLRALICRLRSHELFGQGLRFVTAGATVTGIYALSTLGLVNFLGLPFEAALPIGFSAGIAAHFTLQRTFVWPRSAAFALPIERQVPRYLAVALTQYGVTAAAIATLPRLFDIATELVYVGLTITLTLVSFVTFRTRVFHAGEVESELDHGEHRNQGGRA